MENLKVTDSADLNTAPNTAEAKESAIEEVADLKGVSQSENKSAQSLQSHTDKDESMSVSDLGSAPDVQTPKDSSLPDKRAEFEKLIKGEYKEFYEERIKDNLSKRFKKNYAIEQKLSQSNEIVELLFDRYNIADGDMSRLKKAIEADDAYLVGEADKRGMSIEDYKYLKRLEGENRRFHQRQS